MHVSDLAGNTHDLGFTNPVAVERLVLADVYPDVQPDTADIPLKLVVSWHGVEYDAIVTAQAIDGRVMLQYTDGTEYWTDLSDCVYRWV